MNIHRMFNEITTYSYQTVIIGSGASGYAAADRLAQFGHKDIAIITERRTNGTSRNTGSDKQTYYKLSLSGSSQDSIQDMAMTLMDGLCVDGDHALCEAALSVRSFMHLVESGVPFPCDRYGEFTGYKTDHDPARRATSAGPYTSKLMTEALEGNVRNANIPIYDDMQAIKIIEEDHILKGILCLTQKTKYVLFLCNHAIMATGGPAGIYFDSVYPIGHFGSSGMAYEAGLKGKNLTEWQYGLASVKPRWNVSGTYMQALPRFISTDQDKKNEHEFLMDYFENPSDMLLKVFLKGYQWPFDVRKIENGSSIIDILVFLELQKGRRVFLDYRRDPNDHIDFSSLPGEAYEYLFKAGALCSLPIERLRIMNEPAISFFMDHPIDLEQEALEISFCAQHNNGGLSVDQWWETDLQGFFCIGEASGTHGVYRPGGTALNAGQVGALRAAQKISSLPFCAIPESDSLKPETLQKILDFTKLPKQCSESGTRPITLIQEVEKDMSTFASAFRNRENIICLLNKTKERLEHLSQNCFPGNNYRNFFRLRDILITQQVYLFSMLDYIDQGGPSRGSALYTDLSGKKPDQTLPDTFTFTTENKSFASKIQEVCFVDGILTSTWREPRPIPSPDSVFESVWKRYRKDRNIY